VLSIVSTNPKLRKKLKLPKITSPPSRRGDRPASEPRDQDRPASKPIDPMAPTVNRPASELRVPATSGSRDAAKGSSAVEGPASTESTADRPASEMRAAANGGRDEEGAVTSDEEEGGGEEVREAGGVGAEGTGGGRARGMGWSGPFEVK